MWKKREAEMGREVEENMGGEEWRKEGGWEGA